MTTLDDLAAAAEKARPSTWDRWGDSGIPAETAAYIAAADPTTVLRLVAVARAAQHQRDTRPGAQPQLVAALAALEE